MLTHPKEQGLSNTQKQANKQAKQQKKSHSYDSQPLMTFWDRWNQAPLLVKQVNCFYTLSLGWLCPFNKCSIIGSGYELAIPI